MTFPHRGDIFWVQLDPAIGTESAKTRPALIISNDVGNQYSARVIVALITSGGLDQIYPFEVGLAAGEGGLDRAGKVLLDQLRSIDKRQLGRRLGALTSERLEEVNRAIRLSLAV